MIHRLKLYFSLFFLSIFIFPAIVQDVHAANHEKIFHCDATGEQHLHIQHHDCTLCDFVLPVVSSPSNVDNNFSLFYFASTVFPNQAEVYFSSSQFFSASLRAPPAIS